MKNKTLRTVSGVIAVGLMIIIFLFSAQPGSASDKTSLTLTSLLFGMEDFDLVLFLNVFVRKAAHMAEYAALAVPCRLFAETFDLQKRWKNLLPFLFSAFYAATDEFHQLFVKGRSGQLRDVLIDSVGAALGVFLIWFILRMTAQRKKRTEK